MASIAKIKDDPLPVTQREGGNAYSRLADARAQFHAGGMRKTGSAPNRKGNFFELGDFIVPALTAFRDNGIIGVVSYGGGVASLTIVNLDDRTDFFVIESPLGSAKLPNCHEVQNIGATQTYQRRYLWMTALEIVEHDALEGSEVDTRTDRATDLMPDDEYSKLIHLVQATSSNVAALLGYLKINVRDNNLRLLNQDQYGKVLDALNDKLAKLAKAETDAKAGV